MRAVSGHVGRRLAGLTAAVVLVCAGRKVEACQCPLAQASRLMIPASGTTAFPTDGRVRIFLHGFPPMLRKRMGEEYRLREMSGGLVPIDTSTDGTMVTLAPRSPLHPRSRYIVERVFGYEAGSRLTDQERGYLMFVGERHGDPKMAKRPSVSRLWFPEAWFETGEGPERKRSELPAIEDIYVGLNESNCGPGPAVLVRYQPAGLAATDVVALERKEGGVVRYFPQYREPWDPRNVVRIGNSRCDADSEVVPLTQPWEFRLTTVSASGQRVTPASWSKARIEGTPARTPAIAAVSPFGAFWGFGTNEADGLARWFSPPAGEPATRQEPKGPAGCPWGFESVSRVGLDTKVTRSDAEPWEPVAAAWRSGTLFVVGDIKQSSDPGHLLSRAGDGPITVTELPRPGRVTGAVFAGQSVLLALSDRTDSPPVLERVRPLLLRGDGKLGWRRVFGGAGYNSSPILAWSPRRTLSCWVQSPPDNATTNRIVCTVLSSSDGKTLRAPFELRTGSGASPEHSEGIVNAALAVEGGFLVAWRPWVDGKRQAPGPTLTRLDDTGKTLGSFVVAETNARFTDLIRTDSGVVAAWDGGHGGVEVAWLGPDGRPRDGARPRAIDVSGGTGEDPHWPHLAARRDLVAVSWRVYPRSFVAAVDATGAVSPAFELGAGAEQVITATDDGFIAVHGLWKDVPQVEKLRCRTQPPSLAAVGAPQRIAPGP